MGGECSRQELEDVDVDDKKNSWKCVKVGEVEEVEEVGDVD